MFLNFSVFLLSFFSSPWCWIERHYKKDSLYFILSMKIKNNERVREKNGTKILNLTHIVVTWYVWLGWVKIWKCFLLTWAKEDIWYFCLKMLFRLLGFNNRILICIKVYVDNFIACKLHHKNFVTRASQNYRWWKIRVANINWT